MTYKVYFRCDANAEIGSGHVMRCLAIANKLSKLGWVCLFLCNNEKQECHPNLKNSDFVVLPAKTKPKQADLLVVDHYDLDFSYETACREWAPKIVVIDDLADRKHDCDILIDTTFGRDEDDYKNLTPNNCLILAGPNYAFLRPQFAGRRDYSLKRRQENFYKIENILIYISFTDPNDITGIALKACELLDDKLNIDVILSQYHPDKQNLKTVAGVSKHNIKFYSNVTDMAALMSKADIAIGAGGTTSWERCCLGIPTLLIEIADNQKTVSAALSQAGAIKNLGCYSTLKITDIESGIKSLIKYTNKAKKMSEVARTICDGRGIDRLMPFLMPVLISKDGSDISLRWLDKSDTDIIYEWQSQTKTRRFARNSNTPDYGEHKQWVENTMRNNNRWPYIILAGGKAVGIVRLDKREDEAKYEVSLLISQNHYGKGYALKALKLLEGLHKEKTIYAEIFDKNKASIALFNKAGYRHLKDTWYIKEHNQSEKGEKL